jgi:hypothetical protein
VCPARGGPRLEAHGGERYEDDFFSTAEETMDAEGRDLYIDASASRWRAYDIGLPRQRHAITEEELLALIHGQENCVMAMDAHAALGGRGSIART